MTNTLLSGEQTKEELQRPEREELDWQRARVLLDICYEFYVSEESKINLSTFCEMVVCIVTGFDGDELEGLPERGRNRLVGEVIIKAVENGRVSGNTPLFP